MNRVSGMVSLIRRAGHWISGYGPALFIIGATIGTGSVSSLVVAGADYGTRLIWALIPSCVFFWVLIGAMGRLTFATGKTFVSLVKEQIGPIAGFYIVLAVMVGQLSSNIGVLGIVSEAFASWIDGSFLLSAIFFSTLIYLLIFFGKYSAFEKALMVLVTILGISFIADAVMARPSAAEIAGGLIPQVPEGAAMVVAAMVATTLSGSVIVMRSFVVTDKGWSLSDLVQEKRDTLVSSVLVFLISSVVIICAAATLHVQGLHVDKAIDMATTLVPLLGRFAATLFVVGIVAAGISSAFPNALVSIWTLSDFFGWSRDPRSRHFRLWAILYCAAGVVTPLLGGKPVVVQIASLALQALLNPLLILFMIILLNRKDLTGAHRSGPFMNVLCIIALLFTTFMAVQAFIGLADLIFG